MTVVSGIASLITAIVALVALIGGYVQLVLRRAALPSIEFDVEFTSHHRRDTDLVGEVTLVVKNIGPNTLILSKVRARVRYQLPTDSEGRGAGRVHPIFKHELPLIYIVKNRTFVSSGVAQRYSQPVALPVAACVVDVLGAFDYRIQIGVLARSLIGLLAKPPKDLDWRRGINNHTARRVFAL